MKTLPRAEIAPAASIVKSTTAATLPDAALHPKAFASPEICGPLLEKIHKELDAPLRFMEVCGTHTVSIFRSGLRSLLPEGIVHLSGPGCPVCVTHEREVAAFLELAQKPDVIIATFGDLMRVPGPKGANLKAAKAAGASIEVVYSPLDALALARNTPARKVVFLGVGFETTAPTVAATVHMAKRDGVTNFFILPFHKLVPPALDALLAEDYSPAASPAGAAPDAGGIDAFLLPGHVSTILGLTPYKFMVEKYNKPGVVGGFDPADILQSLLLMLEMRKSGKAAILNQYSRAVADGGNPRACEILFDVFMPADALWRGIGTLPASGLVMRDTYSAFNAWDHFALTLPDVPETKGCKCGDVLKGRMIPADCPLFGKACTPAKPVGPCMVSTEGSCAAYFTYRA